MQKPDWRSPEAAEYYSKHDYADFAQEFLSRNQDYLRDYQKTKKKVSHQGAGAQEEMEVLARRWGMIFPF